MKEAFVWVPLALLGVLLFNAVSCTPQEPVEPMPMNVKFEAVQAMYHLPGVQNATWQGRDMLVTVNDDRGTWRPLADIACVQLRHAGVTGPTQVTILERAAFLNGRWERLASSRCN